MDASVPPPCYSAGLTEIDHLPPAYHAQYETSTPPPQLFPNDASFDSNMPTSLPILSSETAPLVFPSDLRAHLVLLAAFRRLKEDVEETIDRSLLHENDDIWEVFLVKAVYRFQRWIELAVGRWDRPQEARRSLDEITCPPLDVAMVWHTYMLNPRTYREDCVRIHRELLSLGSFPLRLLASSIDLETLRPRPPSLIRETSFVSLTGQPFQYIVDGYFEDNAIVKCPKCKSPNVIPWLAAGQSGFAQKSFKHECSKEGCALLINHESIAVAKFTRDAENCVNHRATHFLSGTLVDQLDGTDKPEYARALTGLILDLTPWTPASAPGNLGWTVSGIESYCRARYMANPESIATYIELNRILRAYRVPGPFSVELTSAVIRQMSFVDKMHHLGWTAPTRFEHDSATLTRCVIRYHAFLELMASSRGKFAVPTLDIDLAWHTHQLLVESYRKLETLIGMIPDHDDKVEKHTLGLGYDETAKHWETRFGVPYSVCGCLPPTPKLPLIKRISSIIPIAKRVPAPSPLNNSRPDLVSIGSTDSAETHASDHNSVVVLSQANNHVLKEIERKKQLAQRAKDLEKSRARGTCNAWSALLQQRECNLHHVMQLSQNPNRQNTPHAIIGNPPIGSCTTGLGNAGMCKSNFRSPRPSIERAIARGKSNQLQASTGCGGGGCGGGCGG